jgi:DNA-binding NtrC family response regulator
VEHYKEPASPAPDEVGGGGLVPTAWILCEDSDGRSAIAVALAASGYEDIVAFEDADQLIAHYPESVPAMAIVDAWTARFDYEAIRDRLAAASVLLLTSEQQGEGWEWTAARKLPKPDRVDDLGPALMRALARSSEARISVASPSSVVRTIQRAPRGVRGR